MKKKASILWIILGMVFLFMTDDIKADESFNYPARINGELYEVLVDGKWQAITIKGVNMGMAKPGTFPGEAGITYEEYTDWMQWIGEMNANVIRVYTLHPPGFYQALYEYNEKNPDKPIYLIHGFWLNENIMHGEHDAYHPELLEEFTADAMTIVDAVHGDAAIPETPGKASGTYTYDVSPYTIGWMFGTEWDPTFVIETNRKHSEETSFDGEFYRVSDGPPFETWIAKQFDFITTYENKHYGTLRPMSFTNWVTTDTLDHISDASGEDGDDAVGVDPNVIELKGNMEAVGQFAAYHIYPYYPEFLNHEPDYINYVDHRGEKNNYAGYLNALKQVVDMPVVVAEFGVPASRGQTHRNPFGWNQGFLSETEQGNIVSNLYEDIIEEGYLGGIVFTWQDEWFKRTWNTMDYDHPHRRPYWSNVQTNEQQFGLLNFNTLKIKLDGTLDAWENKPMYMKDDGVLKSVRVDHDEAYYYVRIDYDPAFKGQFKLPLDVVPGQGNTTIDDVNLSNGIEFYVDINDHLSRIWVDNYYDFYMIQYGHILEMIKPEAPLEIDSGAFSPVHFVLNREVYLPHLDETLPFEYYETGQLKEGLANPDDEDYDSLSDYNWNKEEGWIEMRLPWLLIGAKDPGLHVFNADIAKDGLEAETTIEGIKMGVLATLDGAVQDSFPHIQDGALDSLEMYRWEAWDIPESKPRLKKSYDIIKDLFSNY